MTPFLELSGLRVAHGCTDVFHSACLTVPAEKRVVAICGPSGAGKTTLLRLFTGLHPPVAGHVRVLGQVPGPGGHSQGFLPQGLALFPWKNVLQNVEFALLCRRMPKRLREQVACDALATVGLAHAATEPVWKLSGGMRQRVALARALVIEPQVLFLDEPFSAADYHLTLALCALLSQLAARGQRIVVVSHDLRACSFLADAVLLARAGELDLLEGRACPHPRSPAAFFDENSSALTRQLALQLAPNDLLPALAMQPGRFSQPPAQSGSLETSRRSSGSNESIRHMEERPNTR